MVRKGIFRILLLLVVAVVFFTLIQNHHSRGPVHETYPNERPRSERDREWESRPHRNEHEHERGGPGGALSCSSSYFSGWSEPSTESCQVRTSHGYPLPDPQCTPGGVSPAVTADVLRDPAWRTRSIRNCQTSEAQKHIAYGWYGIEKPRINSNENQVCELDHLVPLELGGADGMGNIWPECGPDGVALQQRYFKQKDKVENYLAEQVKSGRMPLESAQRGIASDWTQYLQSAQAWCAENGRC